MSDQPTNPMAARICRKSCSNLITTDANCPLCNNPTAAHPPKEKEGYCLKCAEGPFPIEQLHLVTWNEDPYLQFDDGDLATICAKCKAEDIAEGDE